MPAKPLRLFTLENCLPALREKFTENPPDLDLFIRVAVQVDHVTAGGKREPGTIDRREIPVFDGKKVWHWRTESLRELWRGNNPAPVFGATPKGYERCFEFLERHIIEICNVLGDRRDAEFETAFSLLRRRPDGKSQDYVHDYLWQAVAFLLATTPLSQGEIEAILGRLERSSRTFTTGPGSRNYITSIRPVYR